MAKGNSKKVGGLVTRSKDPDWTSVMVLLDETTEPGAFICNWDYEDPELRDLLFLADKPSEHKGNELSGTEIIVKYWHCSKILIPDRVSKEDVPVVRTVLISPAKQVLSTLSKGILKSVETLRTNAGTGDLGAGIPMVVMASNTGTGSDMLSLVPKMLVDKQ